MPEVMDSKFSNEKEDRRWAFETQSRLGDQFGRLSSAGNQITSIDCKTSICRLQGIFATQDAFNETMQAVFGRRDENRFVHGGAIAPVFERTTDGQYRAIVYVAREGTHLIDAEPSRN